ncbi:MAG TPA: DUF2934 domain-containing protein [Vicinamibacterales bacterium]|nr:DUF2934 domain-containing protein [Vicinamibacterales bacterium]
MTTTPGKRRSDRKNSTATATSLTAPIGPSTSDIARRAFELYCARGYQPGHELDDWLQAEGELQAAAAAMVAPKIRRRRPTAEA